ncbi:MAG: protein adenylyltransferase SelO, partial [Alphaproteobacteria bacterium]
MFFNFQNTYAKLPQNFYQKIKPTEVSNPKLLYCNESLANSLGLEHKLHDEAEIAQIFSGNKILSNSDPIALAYAGHQFGYFVPQLGDGRAVLLGEIKDQANKRFDVQLKGSGVTAYSRNGDGRAALGPVLREYIISEAMHYLGVKTTRSLAVVSTGENVLRNGMLLPGAILTRIASSHIRIGTFEYFASRGDIKSLKILADYTIDRHYPELKTTSAPYVSLFEKVMEAQIELIVNWMRVGFIHGVMNTDNTSIAGETLDYGPCAFLDEYDPDKVFSAIDYQGRYSFSNQPQICYWNLAQLAQCIALVIGGDIEKSLSILYAVLANFKVQYQTKYYD